MIVISSKFSEFFWQWDRILRKILFRNPYFESFFWAKRHEYPSMHKRERKSWKSWKKLNGKITRKIIKFEYFNSRSSSDFGFNGSWIFMQCRIKPHIQIFSTFLPILNRQKSAVERSKYQVDLYRSWFLLDNSQKVKDDPRGLAKMLPS